MAFDLHDLRQNGQRDLLRRFCPDGKADGGMEPRYPCRVKACLCQLAAHQFRTSPAAHHAYIGRRFLQDLLQAGNIIRMGTGQYTKVCLCTARYLRQRRFKWRTEYSIRPCFPQCICIFRTIFQPGNGQIQQLCQPDRRRCYMSASADDQPCPGTKTLGKNARISQRKHAGSRAFFQCRKILG